MKTNITFLIITYFLIIASDILKAQNDTLPMSLTKQYFNGTLKNYKTFLLSEEIDQDFNTKKITKKAAFSFEQLMINTEKAVVAVSVKEKETVSDCYVFWVNQNGWKIKAIRTLWLPGFYHLLLEKYKNLDDNGIRVQYNRLINENKEQDSTQSMEEIIESFGTEEDFINNIKIMKLTAASDSELIQHLNKHQDKFLALLNTLKKDELCKSKTWKIDYQSAYKKQMQELLISSVSNFDHPQVFSFVVGGMTNNQVGYFYCENPNHLPVMDDSKYIMIRKLGNGWYLFKTT